jgi:HK97 family phage prohead protease
MSVEEQDSDRLPRDNLVRAMPPGPALELRNDPEGGPHLVGHFAVFNEWAEIESRTEGHFMERMAPGAFKRTFDQRRDKIQVLFNHGGDPELGDKALGSIVSLDEDERGAAYDVELFDGIPPLLMSGLRANKYGASFRFSVLREVIDRNPKASDHNPDGIVERTVTEAAVPEFGPVTFPAYEGASAGIRSMTDEYMFSRFVGNPKRLAQLIDYVREEAPSAEPAADPHLDEARDTPPPVHTVRFRTREEYLSWLSTS